MILAAVIGLLIIAVILWEAFETVVLPRRVVRRFRVTVLVYRSMWGPWRALTHRIRKATRRETLLSYFGPLSILFLFVFWAVALIFGFGLLYYSASALAL